MRCQTLCGLFVLLLPLPSYAQSDTPIEQRAYQFLNTFCSGCHSGQEAEAGLRVLDHERLLDMSPRGKPFVDPGAPENSRLWEVITTGEMPLDEPYPSEEEQQVILKWIQADAPGWPVREVTYVSPESIIRMIERDLDEVDVDLRQRRRYFLFNNLTNNPYVTQEQLQLHYAAVSKLINSLSWRPIHTPEFLDPDTRTVMYIDLNWYGWTPDLWERMIIGYPYGERHTENQRLLARERRIQDLSQSRLSCVRADWFVATASRAPLYDELIDLPETLAELEERLGVDLESNFARNDLARAGLTSSGVSRHNRLVERHHSIHGAYWRSYDFDSSDLRGNLVRFPLGPIFDENPFNDFAFDHVGGEVIFHLPNGLMAYMLADADDNRLDGPAPVSIVRDTDEAAGTPEVVNGISCMSCHKFGIRTFEDSLREFPAVFSDARFKVQELYPPVEDMNAMLRDDEERFMRALERATALFLQVGDNEDKPLRSFPEPIGEVSRIYLGDISFNAAAAELGLEDARFLRERVRNDPDLMELGLGVLLDEGALKRELWGKMQGSSLYHTVISRFDRSAYPIH